MVSDPGSTASFYGRFSDGKTAAATDAEVRLGAKGVEIKLPTSALPLLWPYDTLSAAEPLTEYAIDALLTSTASPGASLFATEGTFARRLAVKAPHLSAHSQRWRHARPWIGVAALIGAVSIAISLLDLSPSHAIATLLPDGAREKLGSHVIASMTGERRVCDDAKGLAALNTLVGKLSKASGSKTQFKVSVVDWDLLNAFAVPGEHIITTRKLIAKAASAEEVAGVLAHEMGHGLDLHPETGLVRAIGLSAGVELMLGGSGGTLANLGVALAALSYSREAERDADTHALRILKNASIPAKGFAGFFRRLQQQEGGFGDSSTGKAFDAISSHPNTSERIAKIEAQGNYPAKPALSPAEWTSLKGICGAPLPGRDDDGDGQDDAPAAKSPTKPPATPQKGDRPKTGRDI